MSSILSIDSLSLPCQFFCPREGKINYLRDVHSLLFPDNLLGRRRILHQSAVALLFQVFFFYFIPMDTLYIFFVNLLNFSIV